MAHGVTQTQLSYASCNDLHPSNANMVRWGRKDDLTSPLCPGKQITEHVHSSSKAALRQSSATLEQGAGKSWIQIPDISFRGWRRGYVGSSAYTLLRKLFINGQRRTKAPKPLNETAEKSSRWIWGRRNEQLLQFSVASLSQSLERLEKSPQIEKKVVGSKECRKFRAETLA
ncbi:reverse transcriptase [Plakobranchus ocellatus]|uniref:Reverse transcriptase n=1 Tax=Plakobranchus ocellatus TaxID=259542 RepID=A0AAV4CQM4_9GAST|nr:reverse transcriptase [Plakobranchus ocellatus]